MKKITLYFIILIFAISVCIAEVSATDEFSYDKLESDTLSSLEDIISSDTLDILAEIGISDFSVEEIYNISFKNITDFFSVTLKDKLKSSLEDYLEIFAVILFSGIISSLLKGYSKDNFIDILIIVTVAVLVVNTINGTVTAVAGTLQASGKFMLGFIPVYTLLISLAGNTATALTYNTFAVFFAELISALFSSGLVDFIGMFFCLGISFSVNETINITRFITAVNKTVNTVLGFSASLFTGFLSLKGVLSYSVDRVSVRSIRYLISSMIPIVGSSISEAYSTLLGSINLIKGSVAIVGILVIVIINTPIILENIACCLVLNLLSYLSDGLSLGRVGDVLRVFSAGIRILLLLCIFETFILIITIGIVLSTKGGG